MSKIPAYYLRKPWDIILGHAASKIESWSVSKKVSTQVDKGESWTEQKNASVQPGDIEIKTFVSKSLSRDETLFIKKYKIEYDENFHRIKHGAFPQVCEAIQSYWKVEAESKSKKGQPELLDALNEARLKEDTRKSIFQLEVNVHFTKPEEPLYNGEDISTGLALYICEIALFISPKNSIQYLEIETIKKHIKKEFVDNFSQQNDNFQKRYEEFWSNPKIKIPEIFNNSDWLCYERTDGTLKQKAKWGIAISSVYIGSANSRGNTYISLSSSKGNSNYEYKGLITYDNQSKYLVANLFREDKNELSTPAIFIMHVNDFSSQKLLIGSLSYYSVFYSKFLTKTVIWKSNNGEFSPQEITNVDPNFNTIVDINILRFLYNRKRNRLTMPSTNISDLDSDNVRSLRSWINQRFVSIAYDDILHACEGQYFVCYFYGDPEKAKYDENLIDEGAEVINIRDDGTINNSDVDDYTFDNINSNEDTNNSNKKPKKSIKSTKVKDEYLAQHIRVDELDINFDEYGLNFEAKYIHKLDIPKKSLKDSQTETLYKGNVRRKRLTIEVLVEESDASLKNITPIENYILLNFCVPEEELQLNKQIFFPGILSGLSDYSSYPLSFRAIVIKKHVSKNKEGEIINETVLNIQDRHNKNSLSNQVLQYFRRNIQQSQIKVSPSANNLFDKYPNISILILNGGNIKIDCLPAQESNRIIVYQVVCFDNKGEQLGKQVFSDPNIDEALKKADEWLLKSYQAKSHNE